MTPEQLPEDSDESDWFKQVCLSLLVGVGPYFVNTSHDARAVLVQKAPSRGRDLGPSPKQSAVSVHLWAFEPFGHPRADGPYISNSVASGSAPVPASPLGVPSSPHTIPHPELSAQIVAPVSAMNAASKVYSYGGVTFAWPEGKALTFGDLPPVWACIAFHESSDMVHRSNPASSAKGAFQIKSFMWTRYKLPAYPVDPNDATLSQQYRVALRIFRADGFAEWETAPLCGV